MTHTACEMMWLKNLLVELGFRQPGHMYSFRDNQSATYIAQNLVFHKRTKHIEVDCHLVKDAWAKKVVFLPFILSSKQLVDFLIKTVSPKVFSILCSKLGMIDIYTLA